MTLRLTVPLGRQETPASYTSRLAARNGLTAREFCYDWELRFQAVVDGDSQTIAAIAGLGGIDAATLAVDAFVRRGERTFEHRGERLLRHKLRRSRVHVCPACMLDDVRSHPKLAPEFAVYNRAAWTIDAIRTCPIHETGLVQVAEEGNPHRIHDFAQLVAPSLPRLGSLAAGAPRRRPTGLENYVTVRLTGLRQLSFLDSLPLYAAIHTCEVLGAVDVFGRTVNLQRLGDDDWVRAGAAGFEIAGRDPDGIDAFLSKLQNTYKRKGWEGPQALFGQIYLWLAFFAKDEAYDSVRNVVARHILAHQPVGPGDRIFGVPVTERTLHSVCTLSVESGLHPGRLRKTLRAAGLIGDRQMGLRDNLVLFSAARSAEVVRKSASALSIPEVARHLNVPINQATSLAEEGILKPFMPAPALAIRNRYAVEDVDAFVNGLLDRAKSVRKLRAGMVNIPAAAKFARCSITEIIRLILGRKLSWTGKAAGRSGYLSVLVDVEEIRAKTARTDHGGLTKVDVIRAKTARTDHGGLTKVDVIRGLHTTHAVVDALISHGYLKPMPAINPVNRHQRVVIAPAEFARFDRQYVSLYGLTEAQGKHFTVVRKALERKGVEPAFDPDKIGATFYRRADV
jgi:TniQ